MRIAVVHSHYASDQPSGENVVVEEQVDALLAAGHEVQLVSRKTDDLEATRGYRLRASVAVSTGYGPSPIRKLEEFKPDVIHVHNTFPNFGTSWLRRWGPRTVATLHNYRTVCSAGTLFRDGKECVECLGLPALPAIRHGCYRESRLLSMPVAVGTLPGGGLNHLLHLPAELIALNTDMQEVLENASGRAVNVVPNFVSHAHSTRTTPQSERWAYVGRITAEKGLAGLLDGWPKERALEIFGDGPQRLELQLKHQSLTRITWHGNVDRERILRDLPSFSGLIVPSLWSEGLPTVMLEALARSTPLVISSSVSSGGLFLEAGAALPLPDARTVTEIDATLNDVLARAESIRERALELHLKLYSPKAWLAAIEPIYSRVKARTTAGSRPLPES